MHPPMLQLTTELPHSKQNCIETLKAETIEIFMWYLYCTTFLPAFLGAKYLGKLE